ncbi:MAG: MotA/TolQ/ExbB proton channel family protein, partial [Bacteroidaceae bacterium]|nr:MotA/TolQ/ExbB proton channel family protein [Bacteroidaceae bacterium]
MKKVFAFVAMTGLLIFGVNQTIQAQDAAPAADEMTQVEAADPAAEEAADEIITMPEEDQAS